MNYRKFIRPFKSCFSFINTDYVKTWNYFPNWIIFHKTHLDNIWIFHVQLLCVEYWRLWMKNFNVFFIYIASICYTYGQNVWLEYRFKKIIFRKYIIIAAFIAMCTVIMWQLRLLFWANIISQIWQWYHKSYHT